VGVAGAATATGEAVLGMVLGEPATAARIFLVTQGR
jgi:hypothetical protein